MAGAADNRFASTEPFDPATPDVREKARDDLLRDGRRMLEESLDLRPDNSQTPGRARTLLYLGHANHDLGNKDQAQELWRKALTVASDADDHECLEALNQVPRANQP